MVRDGSRYLDAGASAGAACRGVMLALALRHARRLLDVRRRLGSRRRPRRQRRRRPTAAARPKDEIDVRQYLGPNYCPELRILKGAELMRPRTRGGHEDDPKFVIWQASVGKTARECLYDLQGSLTLKVGVSGRVIAGPKGGAATVTVPVEIAVVKHKEAVLATEDSTRRRRRFRRRARPPSREVKEIVVPSPGTGSRLHHLCRLRRRQVGSAAAARQPVVAVVEEPPPRRPPPAPAAPPAPPPKPTTPNELPVPDRRLRASPIAASRPD